MLYRGRSGVCYLGGRSEVCYLGGRSGVCYLGVGLVYVI